MPKMKPSVRLPEKPAKALLASIPRESIARALEIASQSPDDKFDQMLKYMCDPRFGRELSLYAIARRCNVSLRELTEMFRDSQMMEGTARMLNHVPDVMEDIAIDARSKMDVCPRCNGSGQEIEKCSDCNGSKRASEAKGRPTPIRCKTCEGKGKVSVGECLKCGGTGKIRVVGDEAARKLLMEATGQTGKKGPLVAQQFNLTAGTQSLEDMIAATDRILKSPRVIEGEVSD